MEFDRAQFWQAFLGQYSFTEFIIFVVFFCLGAAIFFGIDVRRSVKKDPTTPVKFNLWFMIRDNIFRFIAVLAAIYMSIRFYEDFYGTALNEKLAMTMGIGIDAIIGKATSKVKDIPALKKYRETYITKLNNGP